MSSIILRQVWSHAALPAARSHSIMGVARMPLYKSTWKSQLLTNEYCSLMSSIMTELLVLSSITKRQHGSCSCSSMSSIMKELLIVSSITKRRHMEVTTEILISYNSKASSMFSQECVGGPKNGSWKLACSASRLYTEQGFTGVNSKLAWRAARLQSSCTGVHSRTRQRSAMVLTMNYANHRSDGD
jgi:hypothetical protein